MSLLVFKTLNTFIAKRLSYYGQEVTISRKTQDLVCITKVPFPV